MKILEPKELEQRRHSRANKHKAKRRKRSAVPFICFILAVYVVFAVLIPAPALVAETTPVKLPPTGSVSMPWPSYGEAAIGAVGYGLLAQNGEQKPLPMASIAKIITAVAVLKVHPIQPGTKGETITLGAQDVATYRQYIAQDQSVIEVRDGEQLTEYQALQALLLPSANNMADALVRWAFGSSDEYLTFVNPFVGTLGMKNTRIADASGFSPKTVSTAVDLAKLAEIAMNHPVIAEIVNQAQADLPVAGIVYNVNKLIGHGGVVGIKTGNTDEAGGCYMFSAKRKIDGTTSVTVVGAIMGAPDLATAIDSSLPLLDEAFKNFTVTKPVETNQIVGTLSQLGGKKVPIIVHQGVSVVGWVAQKMGVEVKTHAQPTQVAAGDNVGMITLQVGDMTYEMPLIAADSIASHSVVWRVRHAGGYL
jgi:serine-type D-Ala-D-Ala carboxypeptidase (penicillin-binding protein 5/6)